MMLRTSPNFQVSRIIAEMKIFEFICIVCREIICRKSGGIRRGCFLILLLFCMYLTSSYVASSLGLEHNAELNNTQIVMEENEEITELGEPLQQQMHIPNETVFLQPGIERGDIVLNCGLSRSCNDNEFSVHIYTGKDNKDEPRFCIDGKYILTKELNEGGRGINAIVVDNITKTVIRVSHFDTYEKESTALETLLLTLRPGDIIILLTFDEPTRKMSRVTRLLLYELGSALIQNLNYRGSWYLVTQKGMNGFSPYEALHSVESNGWPKHHDEHFCVPYYIKGQAIHPDPLPRTNPARVEFCKTYGNYPLFCDVDAINDPLLPTSLSKRALKVKQIYNTPILVMSGENITYLPVMLETLIRQSGINPSLVVVFYLSHHTEVPTLCDLFGFMSVELSQSYTYCERIDEAFETSNLLFPDAKEILYISENVILSPDFLYFMGQCLPLLQLDNSIAAISAFNENGFNDTSFNPTALYRVSTFTSFGILVRRNFFQKAWCNNDTESDPILISNKINGDVVVPDVSRILVVKSNSFDDYNSTLWPMVYFRERSVNYDDVVVLKHVGMMQEQQYQTELNTLLQSGKIISNLPCAHKKDDMPDVNGETFVIYIHQRTDDDYLTFKYVCACFSLPVNSVSMPYGFYKGLLRFMWKNNTIVIVGSSSLFYRHKPPHIQPLLVNLIQ